MMYRPALSGSTIAKIRSITKPAMATVRTAAEGHKSVVIGIGYGVRDRIDEIQALARELNAEIVVSRKIVDNGYLPYELQLGLRCAQRPASAPLPSATRGTCVLSTLSNQ